MAELHPTTEERLEEVIDTIEALLELSGRQHAIIVNLERRIDSLESQVSALNVDKDNQPECLHILE